MREPGEHHCDQEGNRQGGPLHRGLAAVHRCVASKDLERYGQKDQNYFLVAFGCCTTSLFKAILCQMRPAGPPRSVNFTHPQNSFSFHHAFWEEEWGTKFLSVKPLKSSPLFVTSALPVVSPASQGCVANKWQDCGDSSSWLLCCRTPYMGPVPHMQAFHHNLYQWTVFAGLPTPRAQGRIA